MTLAMGPLIILFELSILLARWLEKVSPRGSSSRWGDDDDEDDEDTADDDGDDGGGDHDPFADTALDDDDNDDEHWDPFSEEALRAADVPTPTDVADEQPTSNGGDLTKLEEPDRKD
jgi:hypothetical protein